MLRNMGERGLLGQFPAVIHGRPKASDGRAPAAPEVRVAYRRDQREAVLTAVSRYNEAALVVSGVDIGHTDPQWVLPYGGMVTVDGPGRRLTAHY